MVGWDQVASDFRLCKWPPPLNSLVDEDLARYFDELNSKEFPSVFSAERDKCQVITFSHFLPRYVVLGGVYTHGHLGQSNWVGTLMYACLLFPWKQESKMSVVQQLSFLISTKDLLASSWSFSVSCIKIDPFFLICMQVWAVSREANAVLSKPTKSSGIWLVRGKSAQHSWSSWQWNSLPCVWTHPFLLGCNLRWDQVSNGSCQSNNLLCAKGFCELLDGFSLMSSFVQKLFLHIVRGFVLVVTGIFKLL